MKITPANLNHRAEFGTIETTTNQNTGGQQREFVSKFSLWCSYRTRTVNQLFAAETAGMSDTRTIAVRHNLEVNNSLLVKLDGKTYKIVNISPDDSNNYIAFDFLTLLDNEKVGN